LVDCRAHGLQLTTNDEPVEWLLATHFSTPAANDVKFIQSTTTTTNEHDVTAAVRGNTITATRDDVATTKHDVIATVGNAATKYDVTATADGITEPTTCYVLSATTKYDVTRSECDVADSETVIVVCNSRSVVVWSKCEPKR
jgi:hypothetical protein